MKDKADKVTQELPLKEILDKYDVFLNGVKVMRVNPKLVKQQNISDEQLEEIKQLHQLRMIVENNMKGTDDPSELKTMFKGWTEVQYRLQDAWGFERNANYHRFWDVPKCECSKMDNSDAYPTGYYVINQKCPVHGEIV